MVLILCLVVVLSLLRWLSTSLRNGQAMVSKPRRVVLGFRARSELKRVLESAISIDRRKEWTCKFCSESSVWTSWRCRRCCSNIPVAAKSGEWSTGSSTWSGEEDRKHRSLDAEDKELRARIDALEKKEGVQGGLSIPERRRGFGRCVERVHGSRR